VNADTLSATSNALAQANDVKAAVHSGTREQAADRERTRADHMGDLREVRSGQSGDNSTRVGRQVCGLVGIKVLDMVGVRHGSSTVRGAWW
jgi:hypothetical protein